MPFIRSTRLRIGLISVAIWGVGSCSEVKFGEHLYEHCRVGNGRDEDDDGLWDCDDPDCQVFAQCQREDLGREPPPDAGTTPSTPDSAAPAPPGDAGTSTPQDAGTQPPMPSDGGRRPPDAAPPRDSGNDDEDAGVVPCDLCAEDETCIDSVCQPAAATTSGVYIVSVLSAVVPSTDETDLCYDVCFSPVSFCLCMPDPYVSVFLLRTDGSEELLGSTETVTEQTEPEFPDNAFQTTIEEGELLIFRVYDADSPDDDDFLFECKPILSELASQALSCIPENGRRLFQRNLQVSASIEAVTAK